MWSGFFNPLNVGCWPSFLSYCCLSVGRGGRHTLPRPKKSLQVKGLNPINSLQLFFSPDIGLQI